MASISSGNQFEYLRALSEQYRRDTKVVAYYKNLDIKRRVVQQEMLALLQTYLAEQISTKEFREIFASKTRSEWEPFGLAGYSGGMFLDKLVRHISDARILSIQLRLAIHVPKDLADGEKRLRSFMAYLTSLVKSNHVTEGQIQPGRTPFFLSIWWHMQAMEEWPIYYESARHIFTIAKLFKSSKNPVDDYFAFRKHFLAAANILGLTLWELEHVCDWEWTRRGRE